MIDVTLVLLSLPFTLPLIGVMAFALWRENGLSFYTQDRVGRNGTTFRILKLRTMVPNAAEALTQHLANNPAARDEWNRLQKLKDDPRVTPVGRILRATSLDELPQLWNVFTGDMSLVGPRPMLPEQLPLYGAPQSYFALRPGITGLWQVSARNSQEFAFRNTLDARYEENLSAATDITILFKTVGVVLRRTGH
ncbi:MAG: sugar transferase [Sulfitobacter sp.]|nr:sugar transferase [Sulfitobacter sp.]